MKRKYPFKPEPLEILPFLEQGKSIDFVPYDIEGNKEIKTGKNKGKMKYRVKVKIVGSNFNADEGRKFRWFVTDKMSEQLIDNPNFLRIGNTYQLIRLEYGYQLTDLLTHHKITSARRKLMVTPNNNKQEAIKQVIIANEKALDEIHKPAYKYTAKAVSRYNELILIINDIAHENDEYAMLYKNSDALAISCDVLSQMFEKYAEWKGRKVEVLSLQSYSEHSEEEKTRLSKNQADVRFIVMGFTNLLYYARQFRPENPIAQAKFVETNARLLMNHKTIPISIEYLNSMVIKLNEQKREVI